MANVHDVVKYILHRKGKIVAIKLHKLLYYSQAWALVWDERPLFHARIEAWANGPLFRSFTAFTEAITMWTSGRMATGTN